MKIIHTLRATAATALLLLTPFSAHAQLSSDAEAGRALSQSLNTLSTDPQNVRALIDAGEAALALDDPNGALGFFARAEEVDPRNGRIKAGLGRAMLMTEKPREALKLFNDAVDLGVAEGEVAGDRGLAHDLRGDTRRAQRDYAIALRRGPDAEVTRRMALSLAIGGDREQAMQTLDPLLRAQDRAAWRARAFIMAIGGDVDGANGVARTVMPANLAQPMAPFFARLPSLSSSQKAAAVHFGRIPSDGKTPQTFAAVDPVALPPQPSSRGAVPMSQAMDSGHEADEDEAPARAAPAPAPVSREPRRRPGAPVALAARTDPPVTSTPRATSSTPTPAAASVRTAPATTAPTVRTEAPTPGFSQPVTAPGPQRQPERVAQAAASPNIAVTTPTTNAAPVQVASLAGSSPAAPSQSPPPSSAPTPLERSLASIVQGLELEQAEVVALPEPAARRPVATAAIDRAADDDRKAADDKKAAEDKKAEDKKLADKKAADKKAADKKAAEKKAAAAKPDPKKLHPERIWAQIATGASKSALVTDYGKLVKKSPAAFKGMTGWSVPFKATRRLLVGPFASSKKAEEFLKKAGITGFAWTSPAGTEIEKLGGR